MNADNKKKNHFSRRHWLIIIFSFLLFYFYTAAVPDGMNVILPQLSSENGLNYDLLLTLTTVVGICSVFIVTFLGRLCVILGARKMVAISVLAGGLFFWMYAHASSIPLFIVSLCGLISCANSFAFIGGGALVANWFPTKKGIATGYAAIGAPFSSMTSVAIYTACFSRFGFKPTMTVIALILAAFAVICFIVLRDNPEDCGEYPDSIPPQERSGEELKQIDNSGDILPAKTLLRTSQVWLIAIFVGIYSMVLMGVLAQFVVRHNELPVSSSGVIVMFTVTSAIGLVGGPIWGRLDAIFGTRKAYVICAVSMITGLMLNFTSVMPLVYASLLFFGLGATGTHVFLNAWIVTIFGRRNSSAAYSVIYPVHCIVNYTAYAIIAFARVAFGALRFSYLIFAILLVISVILSLKIRSLKNDI